MQPETRAFCSKEIHASEQLVIPEYHSIETTQNPVKGSLIYDSGKNKLYIGDGIKWNLVNCEQGVLIIPEEEKTDVNGKPLSVSEMHGIYLKYESNPICHNCDKCSNCKGDTSQNNSNLNFQDKECEKINEVTQSPEDIMELKNGKFFGGTGIVVDTRSPSDYITESINNIQNIINNINESVIILSSRQSDLSFIVEQLQKTSNKDHISFQEEIDEIDNKLAKTIERSLKDLSSIPEIWKELISLKNTITSLQNNESLLSAMKTHEEAILAKYGILQSNEEEIIKKILSKINVQHGSNANLPEITSIKDNCIEKTNHNETIDNTAILTNCNILPGEETPCPIETTLMSKHKRVLTSIKINNITTQCSEIYYSTYINQEFQYIRINNFTYTFQTFGSGITLELYDLDGVIPYISLSENLSSIPHLLSSIPVDTTNSFNFSGGALITSYVYPSDNGIKIYVPASAYQGNSWSFPDIIIQYPI